MVEQKTHVNCRFFPINETHSFVQYEINLSQEEYETYLGKKADQSGNKGKVLIQCLDKSGSMAGRPMHSVGYGAQAIGDRILDDELDE